MYHCYRRGRGIQQRGLPPTNINFNPSCTYQHMLDRCKNLLSYTEEEKKSSQFYLADSKGVPIWTSDQISVDDKSGERHLPWTLANYISCSNCRYPSKAKFYCVIKGRYVAFNFQYSTILCFQKLNQMMERMGKIVIMKSQVGCS